jgi:hypothetical protein
MTSHADQVRAAVQAAKEALCRDYAEGEREGHAATALRNLIQAIEGPDDTLSPAERRYLQVHDYVHRTVPDTVAADLDTAFGPEGWEIR